MHVSSLCCATKWFCSTGNPSKNNDPSVWAEELSQSATVFLKFMLPGSSGAVDIKKSIHEIISKGKHNKETYKKNVSSKLFCTLVFILADGVSKSWSFWN